jgi:SM-20-related protein
VTSDLLEQLRNDAAALRERGDFRNAQVGRGHRADVHTRIRGDAICWFDPAAPTPAQARYFAVMAEVMQTLNRTLFLGLAEIEAHYAVYPPSAGYARHLDRFADSDERTVSAVLYLNDGWKDEDGGQLRIHTGDGFLDVLPQRGTLVLFRSDSVWHEVLPSRRERWSIAGWFRRRSMGSPR